MNYQNIARAKAIEQENKKRLLKLNPKLNDRSGIGENMEYKPKIMEIRLTKEEFEN